KGFDLFSLGPSTVYENPAGSGNYSHEPLGGRAMMYSLFELEYPLIREAGLKWVLFYDIGNAFENFPGVNGEAFKLRQDFGFGFRWFSPIGPLRFEWGFPVKPKPWEESPLFVFWIGQPF
ncbi:MAG: BamA/TamA family outer membrane protein, partial [Bdellovibrionota bacterium]